MAKCINCGTEFVPKPNTKGFYCSRSCAGKHRRGPNHPSWKGGRNIRPDGYVDVYVGSVDGRPLYELEHRLVMAQNLGRDLGPGEHVHHRNGDRADNRAANLELISCPNHTRLHHPGRDPDKWRRVRCLHCGRDFDKRVSQIEITEHHYCSRQCYDDCMQRTGTRTCIGCGSEFRGNNPQRKYCSQECYHSTTKPRKRITVVCANCEHEFDVIPAYVARSKTGKLYCNRKCYLAARNSRE